MVILDPALAQRTPEQVWTSTGIRAVDHCVETLCRVGQEDEKVDEDAREALRALVEGLLRTMEEPGDVQARLATMIAAAAAMDGELAFCL